MTVRALWLLAAMAAGDAFGADQAELRVSMIPDEAPAELIRKFDALKRYLERAVGMPVRYVPATDYPAVVEALAAKRVDLAWLGGFTFVQARRKSPGVIPIVQREEDAQFHTRIIVPAHSQAKQLADLRGASFAFGSAGSTSGHLMPRYYLLKAGINPEKDFRKIAYTGAHDATTRWVAAGKVDAGAVNELVFDKLVEEKRIDPDKVRVLWTTPPYPDYNWTVRAGLEPALVEKLRNAFLALDPANGEHKAVLELQRTRKFIPTKAENYDSLMIAATASGLIAGSSKPSP